MRALRACHKNSSTPLSGKGKLTDKVVNLMQNYFGLAIRQNQGDLYGMKKAIWVILWHSTNFEDDHYRHRFCPTSDDFWCKFKKDEQNGSKAYKKSINLPVSIFRLLKPIFEDLNQTELLAKCLHGKTQNCNESLNNIIWRKCPKQIYVQRRVLEIGVNCAIIDFNDGPQAINNVWKYFFIQPGHVAEEHSIG